MAHPSLPCALFPCLGTSHLGRFSRPVLFFKVGFRKPEKNTRKNITAESQRRDFPPHSVWTRDLPPCSRAAPPSLVLRVTSSLPPPVAWDFPLGDLRRSRPSLCCLLGLRWCCSLVVVAGWLAVQLLLPHNMGSIQQTYMLTKYCVSLRPYAEALRRRASLCSLSSEHLHRVACVCVCVCRLIPESSTSTSVKGPVMTRS